MDAEAEEVLNELNLLTAEGEDTNMSSNKIEDSDWTKSMSKLQNIFFTSSSVKLIAASQVTQMQQTQLDVH